MDDRTEWQKPPRDEQPKINTYSIMSKTVTGLQNCWTLARDKPVVFSVSAMGSGAACLLLSPLVVTAGQAGMITGGVLVGLGILLDQGEEKSFMKTGGLILGGSTAITGAGYLLTATGAVAAIAGIGVGTIEISKGTYKAIDHARKLRAAKQTNHPANDEALLTIKEPHEYNNENGSEPPV